MAAEKAASGDRLIIGGQDTELSILLEWLEQKTGRRMPRRRIHYALANAVGFVSAGIARVTNQAQRAPLEGIRLARRVWNVDSSRAQKVLDWHPGEVRLAVFEAVDGLMSRVNPIVVKNLLM